ncbi:hypothetical protein LAV60_12430 [Clostridium sporogenes]|jgi:hypothetical protein|nr:MULTISPECIES: hypothetical protein [Clostridium]EKS4343378.1 hypothetical protein [Clostridium botulinum]EKS4394423.1 hypothetical protein [Clostridium botulinum]MCW6078668.1 hypothetical protein [Clostridium sporogenes]MCW6093975.1 hypothetical protein [Clostridium sporogenes]MDI6919954.1 hypothetical protein [Clostridium botulinum]
MPTTIEHKIDVDKYTKKPFFTFVLIIAIGIIAEAVANKESLFTGNIVLK